MNDSHFDDALRRLTRSRRSLAAGAVAAITGLLVAPGSDARKKRKRKHKQKCGKAGNKPVNGTCCARTILVDGVCQRCDVCASGCAFSSVQAAIDAAARGATIAICPGTYHEDLSIVQDVRLVGAGDGQGSGATILQGTADGAVVTNGGGVVALEQVRIIGGMPGNSNGSGIANGRGTVTLTSCTVSGNTGEFGGGIRNSGTLRLIASEISGNTAGLGGGLGGGIYNLPGATVTFLDAASRVTRNAADPNIPNSGGGIFNNGGTVTLGSSANVTGNTPNNCAGDAVALCDG
jgi:hypothetical protein